MIDTHCHLYDEAFAQDFEEVIGRARSVGIQQLLLPNIDWTSWPILQETIAKCSMPCYPMLGMHPCYVKEDFEQVLDQMHRVLEEGVNNLVAIGEIGMDLYWDQTYQKAQETAFRRQLEWALAYQLPVALHVREAFEPVFQVLNEYKNTSLSGVFHCFTGTQKEASYIMEHHPSFYFGIGGVLTYKKSGLYELVPQLPKNRLLLETDAPYLPPTPYRGKRNEPSYLAHIADILSNALEIPEREAIRMTTENAQRLFNLNLSVQ